MIRVIELQHFNRLRLLVLFESPRSSATSIAYRLVLPGYPWQAEAIPAARYPVVINAGVIHCIAEIYGYKHSSSLALDMPAALAISPFWSRWIHLFFGK